MFLALITEKIRFEQLNFNTKAHLVKTGTRPRHQNVLGVSPIPPHGAEVEHIRIFFVISSNMCSVWVDSQFFRSSS